MQEHIIFDNYCGKYLHLGVTGSVSAYKSLDLLRLFLVSNLHVSATLTASAGKFVTGLSFESLGASPVYGGLFDDESLSVSVFSHLEPGQNADALLICPATANTLAKLACGLADDMLSCQALSFPGPVIVAPAMNPRLWCAAATQKNWSVLKERGLICIEPVSGSVACGDVGHGRLAAIEDIYLESLRAVTPKDLAGRKILINLGPTREYFDSARYWSNPSTGFMGGCLAVSAWLRGAEVTVVSGPVELWLPADIKCLSVVSASQMYCAVMDIWPDCDIACLSAAVADFRPGAPRTGKMKKTKDNLQISFEKNPDILASLGKIKKKDEYLIGFAAQTDDLKLNARQKLTAKNLDLIIANDITAPGCGFGCKTNGVTGLDSSGRQETWPVLNKTEVAWRIWDWLLLLLR